MGLGGGVESVVGVDAAIHLGDEDARDFGRYAVAPTQAGVAQLTTRKRDVGQPGVSVSTSAAADRLKGGGGVCKGGEQVAADYRRDEVPNAIGRASERLESHPDHPTFGVECRSAAVSRIDRGVDLQHEQPAWSVAVRVPNPVVLRQHAPHGHTQLSLRASRRSTRALFAAPQRAAQRCWAVMDARTPADTWSGRARRMGRPRQIGADRGRGSARLAVDARDNALRHRDGLSAGREANNVYRALELRQQVAPCGRRDVLPE